MLHTLAFESVTLKAGIEPAYMGTKLTASYRCYHWCTEYNVLLFNIPFWNSVKYQVIGLPLAFVQLFNIIGGWAGEKVM